MFKILLKILKNKFFLVTVAFLVWLIFFDNNNILSRLEARKKLRVLQQQKTYYLQEIEKNKKETIDLQTDTGDIEKFAREKYLMKKDSEEVFIMVEDEE
jgi:cell division protein FtsB